MTEKVQTLDALKPYPAYEDSGVEWVGQVPPHWEMRKLKQVCRMNYGDALATEHREEGDVPVFGSNGIVGTHSRANTLGPVLVIGRKGSFGKVNSSLVPVFAIDTSFYIDASSTKSDLNWLKYALSLAHLDSISQDTGVPGLSRSVAYAQPLPEPSSEEQTAIAAFLDHETARIDELVREQELLLEDLAEKRRATVNHATKAAVPLDASALPAGWRNVPLKTLLTSFEQGWSPQCDNRPAVEGEWGVLKVGCVNGHTFNAEENKVLPDDLEPLTRYSLKQDDVLISRANTRDLVGSAARVERDYPNLLLCDKLYRLRTDAAQLRPAYLVLLLNSPIARAAIETSASGASASMVNISQGTIRNLLLPIPPLGEQDAIIAHLDERLAQIDQLVLEVRANIEDMKLLRSTLITAATTGKIDVRDWKPA